MPPPAFATAIAQLQALQHAPEQTSAPGHCPLGPTADLWLSTDPAGQARLSCAPAAEGFALRLENGDSGLWASFGIRLELAPLRKARYLGLLAAAAGPDLLIYTPTLRCHLESGGFTEISARPVVCTGDAQEQIAHIPLDPDLLARSSGCELNLFFQTAQFQAVFRKIELLAMA